MRIWIMAALAFLGATITGRTLLPWLIRLKVGQHIREEGPQSHLKKTGTPTMGGLFFLIPLGTVMLFEGIVHQSFEAILLFLGSLGFAAIGFVDDYQKVVKKRNLGLTARQKIALQTAVSVLIILLYAKITGNYTVQIPFLHTQWSMGFFLFLGFSTFVFLATVNSVNLTDGLDGLSSSVTVIVLAGFFLASRLLEVSDSISVIALAAIGSLLGFLVYNRYPARVFMGDLGSLGLGGLVSVFALLMGLQWWIPIMGCIYFAEALSVILQVASFKTRGKRIFRMSPLHHHYELGGLSENQIVLRFSLVSLLAVVIGILAI
mgnify:CR=1 FL=1